jgi:putative ABC transport system permease protein
MYAAFSWDCDRKGISMNRVSGIVITASTAMLAISRTRVLSQTRERSEIPAEHKWKPEDLYASDQAWKEAKDELVAKFDEIKKAFLLMDMFLFAVGMIAITVSALGIINTMIMSVLERYKEIGIMKAVGASDKDVRRVFLFESGMIGLLGGIFGLVLGWMVSILINQIANHFTARQGVPNMDYFSFPLWLCIGAVAFSITVSLIAGVYPTLRAARVDPVVALRHD